MEWQKALELAGEYWEETLAEIDNCCMGSDELFIANVRVSYESELNLSPQPLSLESSSGIEPHEPVDPNPVWTPEEDDLLAQLAEKYKLNFKKISKHFPRKTLSSIEKRWSNKHDPNVKRTKWTQEEDEVIKNLYSQFGADWNKISCFLSGRPPEIIKNRFYGTIRKRELVLVSARKKRTLKKSNTGLDTNSAVLTEEEIADSFISDKLLSVSNKFKDLSIEQGDVDSLSPEEKRARIQELYNKKLLLEDLISQVKVKIEEEAKKNSLINSSLKLL